METAKRVLNVLGLYVAVVFVFFFFLWVFKISGLTTWEDLGRRLSEFRYVPAGSILTSVGTLVFLVAADAMKYHGARVLLLIAATLSAFASIIIMFI